MSKLIYLREADEFVGPFAGRGDAERFLFLMTSLGESLVGIEIVEIDTVVNSAPKAVSVEERKQLLDKLKRSPEPPEDP